MLNSSLLRTNTPLFRASPLLTTPLRSRNAATFLFGYPPNTIHIKLLLVDTMKGQVALPTCLTPSCRRFVVTCSSHSYSSTRSPDVDWKRRKMALPYLKFQNSRYGRVAFNDIFNYEYDDRMIVSPMPNQTTGNETHYNLNQWERELKKLLSNNGVQEIVSREKKDRRDFRELSALATRMGLLSHQYARVVVFSKVRLPNYRPDLDDERPQREVRLPMGLQTKVEVHLREYLSQKPPGMGNFGIKKFSRSSGGGVATINGAALSHGSLRKTNTSLKNIDLHKCLQLSHQQQEWQESPEGQKMQDFRSGLPAYKEKDGFLKTISENQVVVVSGETGCGKTTQLPQYILESEIKANRGSVCSIICTQPRRISAMSVSERVAAERGEKVGDSVGYKVRLEGMKSKDTRLLFCTTGVLLRRLLVDGDLHGVTHVVVDEIHERGMNEDFLLVILKDMLPRRPDLRLILMSATLNADLFSSYFGGTPMIHIPGFTFPVQTHFLEDILEGTGYRLDPYNQIDNYGKEKSYKMHKQLALMKKKSPIAAAVEDGLKSADFRKYSFDTKESLSCWNPDSIGFNLIQHVLCYIVTQQRPGAVLVFLTGWDDINSLKDQLQAHPILGDANRVLLLACHGSMASSEQRLIFDKPEEGVRKIVLATNMAETSITINDVVFVVDAGKAKETSYDALNNTPCLLPSWISKAAARQRRGRAGRVQPGVCFHLYPRCVYDTFSDYQIPELLRTPLESLCLQIKSLQLGSISDFLSKALQPPEPLSIQNAIEYLKIIGALDEDENMTVLGHNLAMLPVEPKLGKMLILGAIFDCLDPILTIVATLSCRDPFIMPFDKKDLAQTVKAKFSANNYSDHLALVRAYEGWKDAERQGSGHDYCWSNFLSAQAMKAIDSLRNQFFMVLKETGLVYSSTQTRCTGSHDAHLIQAIICAGLFPGICSVANKEKSILLKTMDDGQVLLQAISVNAQKSKIPYPWLVFNEKMKVNAVFLRDSTAICDSMLLLFGGDISKGGQVGHLQMMGGYFEFFMQPSLANVYLSLKTELQEMIQEKLQNPRLDLRASHRSLLSAIRLLISGDRCEGKFISIRHHLSTHSKSATNNNNSCGGNGGDNSKNQLQTVVVRAGHDNPSYITKQVGETKYCSTVFFNNMRVAGRVCSSKKEAEKSAAARALVSMQGGDEPCF